MNVIPQKLCWTISTLHFFAVANLAAAVVLLLSGQSLTRSLIELYPIFTFLTNGWLQVSCISVLLVSTLLCEVAAYGLSHQRSWSWTLALVLLVVSMVGWSAGGITILVAAVGIFGLLGTQSRAYLSMRVEEEAPLVQRTPTIRLD